MSESTNTKSFTESDLVAGEGVIYHLALRSDQLAQSCILVGDPERVPLLAEHEFASIEHDVTHRGLRTMTGTTSTGNRLSFVTTGMGTASSEVVLAELVALNEIDLLNRARHPRYTPISAVRVGTSGALQPDEETPLGTLIISEYAIGLDNTGLFYDVPVPEDAFLAELQETVEQAIVEAGGRGASRIKPYVSKANEELVMKLEAACKNIQAPYKRGITASSAGFFANQGRDILRVSPVVPDIDRVLAELRFSNGLKIENMEMESSFLFHLFGGLGYPAGAICVAVANRSSNTFLKDTHSFVRKAGTAARIALET